MKVALVHDWLTGMRGGEKVLEVLCELYPDADLFTLFHHRGSVSPLIERRRIPTSFIQHLPFASQRYRQYLPLFPLAVRQFGFDGYDLVDQHEPLRRQGDQDAAPASRTSATAIRRCATPGISSMRTSDPSASERSASRFVYRPMMTRNGEMGRRNGFPRRSVHRQLGLRCRPDPAIL